MQERKEKCDTCTFKDKRCYKYNTFNYCDGVDYKPKVKNYQLAWYTEDGVCFDEEFLYPNDREPFKAIGMAASWLGSGSVRVFVNYEDGTIKEMKLNYEEVGD